MFHGVIFQKKETTKIAVGKARWTLKVVTLKNDSTIEGFFHTKLPIVGVMWHPERDHAENSELILRNIYDDNFWK